jgi:uncharacterized protein (TIGR00266 family)
MQVQVAFGPGNAAARIALGAGESITSEAGAMIAMSGDMAIETTTHARGQGSIRKAIGRLLSGESFFLNHFTAGPQGGELWLATTLPGDMMTHALTGQTLIVQAGSFVACEDAIQREVGWQGFKAMFGGERMFWLKLKGHGTVVLGSFGAIYPIDVDGEHVVDSGHIVAFEETLSFQLSKAGKSWMHSMLGGEGLVCHFKGRGRVWCQSHNPRAFGRALGPKLKPR